jgi:RNA polymerase sigma-70 factor (ECF subfamily)
MAESGNAPDQSIPELVEGIFRRFSGQLTATLLRTAGRDNIDLIEEAVQDAFISALKTWPLKGIPEKPEAWLYTSAKNRLIDILRREQPMAVPLEEIEHSLAGADSEDAYQATVLRDDFLRCIFACCHPNLPREAQATLTLRVVCGFSAAEIAKMLLLNEESVTRRITRAKELFRKTSEPDSLFEIASIPERFAAVLDVIYLLLNAGHTAPEGSELTRPDLAEEARYLAMTLANHDSTAKPELFALLALIHFHLSRLPARLNENGELVTLEEQNRSLWNKTDIEIGVAYLDNAASGTQLTEYHLQAGIAFEHAKAKSFTQTNWKQVIEYYDMLGEINSSPIIVLNRAVAFAMYTSPKEGLDQIEGLTAHPQINRYYLYHAVLADLLRRDQQWEPAIAAYQRAIELVSNDIERKYLERRLAECQMHS